ncbi:MAG: RNase H family protein [Clostridiales bacterium]
MGLYEMLNKEINIYTDASNVLNLNLCKISIIIKGFYDEERITEFYDGKINQGELNAVLKSFDFIKNKYHKLVGYKINIYSDHQANVKFLNTILNKSYNNSNKKKIKFERAMNRKNLELDDLKKINEISNENEVNINWIPRKNNKEADKLSKYKKENQ